MRVLLVSLYFPPASFYGGPLVSALELCRAWAEIGIHVDVLTTNADGPHRKIHGEESHHDFITVKYARTLTELFAPAWPIHFVRRVIRADVVYVWGLMVWMLPVIVVLCRLLRKRLLISPRGMLFPPALKLRSAKKSFFIAFVKLVGIGRFATFHATSDSERESIASTFPGASCVVIPNGVKLPEVISRSATSPEFILFLGRLHPIKRIELLIESFASLPHELRERTSVIIAGDGDPEYLSRLRGLAHDLFLSESVQFVGQVTGPMKQDLLTNAAVVVLPSLSENFGMSIAEALAHGTPVIATRGTPWKEVESRGCGWWVDGTAADVSEALMQALKLTTSQRVDMGLAGRRWMEECFSWRNLASTLIEA